jgi:hypothetical protein
VSSCTSGAWSANVHRISGTPSAVLVLPDGTLDGPAVAGAQAIFALTHRVVKEPPRLRIDVSDAVA